MLVIRVDLTDKEWAAIARFCRTSRGAWRGGGYFGRAVTEAIEASGATAHIPSQSNVRVVRSVDRELYRNRNLIERFFNRLKHFRGIATRYFKTAANFLAAIHLAAARLWNRNCESTTSS